MALDMISATRAMLSKVTIGFALALVGFGIGMFLWTGASSPTALILAVFGGILLVTGLFGLRECFAERAMQVALLVALLGFLGALLSLFLRGPTGTHEALLAKAIMLNLCGWLLASLIR
jgi:hypothetical protein